MKNRADVRAEVNIRCIAINPRAETNAISPVEVKAAGTDMIQWGRGNAYPDYLLLLYQTVPTLSSIINGTIDYISGNGAAVSPLSAGYAEGEMNTRGDTIEDQLRDIAKDYLIYGGFALQVIRNAAGEVAEVYYIDMRYLRMNKECDVFYYSESWTKSGRKNVITYPAFMPGLEWATMDDRQRNAHASSILFVKNIHTQVYPAPLYAAAVKAAEIERRIDDYHLNAINNGFVSSMIVNFNNGVPTPEAQEEIEEMFNEKFSGNENAGRILFSWNKSKDSATEIVTPEVKDFGDHYKALSSHSRQQLFTAFRANPNLFGIPTEGNGFANEQYEESFRLFNRTVVRPAQKKIERAYERIYQKKGVLTIIPFDMNESSSDKSEN